MTKRLKSFFDNEAAGGILLLFTALLAFTFSNSSFKLAYFDFINYIVFGWTLHHIVNDALMVIFFYVVGLEIKKEIFEGELSDPKKSSLAIFGALGGMVVPATIYFLFNSNDVIDKTGWAIPMATDIAFAVGILTLLGKRVPLELKIFLLALAIVDDLGAIIVIALFYTKELSTLYLLSSLIPFTAIYLMNKYKPMPKFIYIIMGIASWYLIYKSGIHATIAGVILAFLTPFKLKKDELRFTTPLTHWLHTLHPIVTFSIMPIFAFFNSGLTLDGITFADIFHSNVSLGVLLGLVIGKPLGIVIFCYFACMLRISKLPDTIDWLEMAGVGLLAGIGFTMSLFINGLTFGGTGTEDYAKLGILIGSIVAAIIGFVTLRILLSRRTQAAAP